MTRVTIGLPVYNGERYLEQAIESLLAQDFRDFELLIGDNASTDCTLEICRRFAAADPRVRLLVSDVNRGAAWNFSRLVPEARGEYFMWAAHDDYFAPTMLSRCVHELDTVPDAVLCSVGVQHVANDGTPLGHWHLASPRLSKSPARRFADVVRRPQWHQAFALVRTQALRTTGLMGGYAAADGVLLAELALRGRFVEIPEPLFFNREHGDSSTEAYPLLAGRNEWWDTARSQRRAFPRWRLAREYLAAIGRSPVRGKERVQAVVEVFAWCISSWRRLVAELIAPAKPLFRGTGSSSPTNR